ncbi:hypothetical protein ANCCAN_23968 [Ancylostoma caninum]|uniref:Endonuclease/exonuclease/phosphatase domain-containing protein n=1 Tax=Ancylostoma caninum TaxID=29170 RepID=A0A368FDW3_ANCCA|nr:hypothetical protein ANCCAN_23968 [Ancylostoma caninum]
MEQPDQRMFQPRLDQIQVATLNVRRLSPRERLMELQESLRRTHVDILALKELRWKGTGCMDLVNSDYRFFYAGSENTTAPSGTGFFVSSRFAPYVDAFERENDRISRLDLWMGEHIIRCFSIYAPTSSSFDAEDEEQYSKFLEEFRTLLQQSNPHKICSNRRKQWCNGAGVSKGHILLLGDFNAKLGKKENEAEICIGQYGYDDVRNARGRLLIEFCEQLHL